MKGAPVPATLKRSGLMHEALVGLIPPGTHQRNAGLIPSDPVANPTFRVNLIGRTDSTSATSASAHLKSSFYSFSLYTPEGGWVNPVALTATLVIIPVSAEGAEFREGFTGANTSSGPERAGP